jgi:O-antigen ligase
MAFPYLNFIYSILLFIGTVIWLLNKKRGLNKIQLPKYPIMLFILALCFSIVFSQDKLNGLQEFHTYLMGILLFTATAILDENQRKQAIRIIILSAVIISLLAIYQYFFGFRHTLDYITKQGITDSFVIDYLNQKRVFYPFVTPNALAGYLIIIMPLVLILKRSMSRKLAIIAPLFIALLLTKSLGGFLSLFAGAGIYVFLKKDSSNKKFIIFSLLGLILTAVFILRELSEKEHLLPLFSLAKRISYWWDTLLIIKNHPLIGIGLGNLNIPFSLYAHNSYLQLWAETGIAGLASFLWLITAAVKTGLKVIKNNPAQKSQTALLLSANIIFLLHNLVDFTFFLPEISLIWWIILGLNLPLLSLPR